ncbi:MAG: hypothetical protein M3495_06525 [Pseudomonadota bacterium]|nr:hypothetical protein [Pseudomonadota bacterium]
MADENIVIPGPLGLADRHRLFGGRGLVSFEALRPALKIGSLPTRDQATVRRLLIRLLNRPHPRGLRADIERRDT